MNIPEGFVLVPADPIKAIDMGWAYLDAAREAEPGRDWAFSHSGYRAMIAAAPVPPSVESLMENWTPSDQQAFAKFRDEHFPGEMSSYAIQSLGSAWKDGQANAAPSAEKICRDDGRCEYAIQSGAETEGSCPAGKCAMPCDNSAGHLTARMTTKDRIEWMSKHDVDLWTDWMGDPSIKSHNVDEWMTENGVPTHKSSAPQPAAHLTIPGALEWDGDNGTHSADSAHSESSYDDVKEACAEVERTGAPGDVIREMNDELVDLRTEMDGYKAKWLANCEALKLLGIHARHAEKLVKSCREKLDVDSVGKGFIEALDGFIGALSHDDNTHGESEVAPSAYTAVDMTTAAADGFRDGMEAFSEDGNRNVLAEVFFQKGDDPFICAVRGRICVEQLEAAQRDFRENLPDELEQGDGIYTFDFFYEEGQYDEFGRCEIAPGWGFDFVSYAAFEAADEPVIERAVETGVMNAPKPYVAMTEAEADEFLSSFGGGSGNKAKRRIAAIQEAKQKTCIECDQPYCHGVCVERGDQDYDRDQAAKGGDL